MGGFICKHLFYKTKLCQWRSLQISFLCNFVSARDNYFKKLKHIFSGRGLLWILCFHHSHYWGSLLKWPLSPAVKLILNRATRRRAAPRVWARDCRMLQICCKYRHRHRGEELIRYGAGGRGDANLQILTMLWWRSELHTTDVPTGQLIQNRRLYFPLWYSTNSKACITFLRFI